MSVHQETADDYGRVLAASGRWRVIRCRDDLQFIAQRRGGGGRARPWEAKAFIMNSKALGPVMQRPSQGIPADDLVHIEAELQRSHKIA